MASKKLSRANDVGVPADEMSLAALLQNAKAWGLGWTREAYFRYKGVQACNPLNQDTPTPLVDCCCALGAGLLNPMLTDSDRIIPPSPVANDDVTGRYDRETYRDPVELGHAFRSAMCDGDPWKV